jgi:integrase/recombinase XerD
LDRPVSGDWVSKTLKRLLGGELTAHTLRHRFATKAYQGSKDIRAVQELLGHSSPATTAVYTLIEDDALAAAVASVA